MGTATSDGNRTATSVEFRVRDRDCFFIDASAVADCRVELEHLVHRSDGRLLEYFTVEGASPERVLALAADADGIAEARLAREGMEGHVFEFVVAGPCVTTTLADSGAIARSVAADRGAGRVAATVPPHVEVREVVEHFREHHPHSELAARRDAERSVPISTRTGAQTTLAADLTAKQREVLRTAYLKGYFSWPRESTADECAEVLGISQPTFSQHIRAAEEKLVGGLFEGATPEP